MAEWSALQTGKRGDPSSIPTDYKRFFEGIKSAEHYFNYHFEIGFNFKLNYIFFNLKN